MRGSLTSYHCIHTNICLASQIGLEGKLVNGQWHRAALPGSLCSISTWSARNPLLAPLSMAFGSCSAQHRSTAGVLAVQPHQGRAVQMHQPHPTQCGHCPPPRGVHNLFSPRRTFLQLQCLQRAVGPSWYMWSQGVPRTRRLLSPALGAHF